MNKDFQQVVIPRINIGGEMVAPSITLRDHMAMAALFSMPYIEPKIFSSTEDEIDYLTLRAEVAYAQADAMLTVRAKLMAYKKKGSRKNEE